MLETLQREKASAGGNLARWSNKYWITQYGGIALGPTKPAFDADRDALDLIVTAKGAEALISEFPELRHVAKPNLSCLLTQVHSSYKALNPTWSVPEDCFVNYWMEAARGRPGIASQTQSGGPEDTHTAVTTGAADLIRAK